ncbi:MAG: hypothetical protein ACOWWO_11495 [Peptococcaceae bacterium]
MAGVILKQFIPLKLPSVAYIVLIGCIIDCLSWFSGCRGGRKLVGFLALPTPILVYAGIAISKDLDVLKKTGWKIVIVACFVFVGSAAIAQEILKAMEII